MSRKSKQGSIVHEYLPQLLEVGREVRVCGEIAIAIDIHLAVCPAVRLSFDRKEKLAAVRERGVMGY